MPHDKVLAVGDTTGLIGTVSPVTQLASDDRQAMYHLLDEYYENVTCESFERDLNEKDTVIILRDTESGSLRGFTTQVYVSAQFDGEHVEAIFSGDTVVRRENWGQTVLARVWARHAWQRYEELGQSRLYWFLASGSWRTYRFLPLFFSEYYPNPKVTSPNDLKRLLDVLALQKFGDQYDRDRGVIRLSDGTPVRPRVADVTPKRLADPHVAFYVSANPHYVHGHLLACLAQFHVTNFTKAARRML